MRCSVGLKRAVYPGVLALSVACGGPSGPPQRAEPPPTSGTGAAVPTDPGFTVPGADTLPPLARAPAFTPYTDPPVLRDTAALVEAIRTRLPAGFTAPPGAYVVPHLFVDQSGRVRNALLRRSSGSAALDHAVLAAVREARFRPAQDTDRGDVPVWWAYPLGWPKLHDPPIGFGFACGRWGPYQPARERVIVDLPFRSQRSSPVRAAEVERLVEAAGGRVLHRFNVALLRAELDTVAVRTLASGPGAIAFGAFAVADPTEHGVTVAIRFKDAFLLAEQDSLARLGGHVLGTVRGGIRALVPDSAIPRIRGLAGVREVALEEEICLY